MEMKSYREKARYIAERKYVDKYDIFSIWKYISMKQMVNIIVYIKYMTKYICHIRNITKARNEFKEIKCWEDTFKLSGTIITLNRPE